VTWERRVEVALEVEKSVFLGGKKGEEGDEREK